MLGSSNNEFPWEALVTWLLDDMPHADREPRIRRRGPNGERWRTWTGRLTEAGRRARRAEKVRRRGGDEADVAWLSRGKLRRQGKRQWFLERETATVRLSGREKYLLNLKDRPAPPAA